MPPANRLSHHHHDYTKRQIQNTRESCAQAARERCHIPCNTKTKHYSRCQEVVLLLTMPQRSRNKQNKTKQTKTRTYYISGAHQSQRRTSYRTKHNDAHNIILKAGRKIRFGGNFFLGCSTHPSITDCGTTRCFRRKSLQTRWAAYKATTFHIYFRLFIHDRIN